MLPTNRLYPFFILTFVLSAAHNLSAQQPGRVTGQVVSEAGAPLGGVAVSVVRAQRGVFTDRAGNYSLELPAGTYTLRAQLIGYRVQTFEVTVGAGETVRRDLTMVTDPLGMQELVVTATREAVTQQDATFSVTLVPAEKINKFQPQSAAEVLRTVPGIHAEEGGGEVAVNSFLRGLPSPGQFRYQTLQEDGMPVRSIPGGFISAEDVFFRYDYNVRTLEVVKGGVSPLFGINAPAGTINYVSKTGGDILTSTVAFTGGQRDYYRVDMNVNGPLGEDWRFNVGGFYRLDRGPRISGLDTRGFQIKGNVTRLLEGGHLRFYAKVIDDKVQFLLPFAHRRATGKPAIDENGTQNSDAGADFTVPTPASQGLFPGSFRSTMDRGVLTSGQSVMFEVFQEFGEGWSVENKVRWSDMDHEFNIFIPFGTQPADEFAQGFMTMPGDVAIFGFVNDPRPFSGEAVARQGVWGRFRPTEDLANQFILKKRVEGPRASALISVGGYFSRTEVSDVQIRPTMLFELATRPRAMTLEIRHADGSTTPVTMSNGILEISNNFFNRQFQANNVSVFGGTEITVDDRFRIDVGGRFQRQTASVRVENTSRFDLGTTLAEQNAVFGNGTFVRRNVDFDDFAVALGMNYKVADALNVYGNFSRSFFFPTLGIFAGDVRIDEQGNFVQPVPEQNEELLQAEGGVKIGTPQYSATISGFWTQISDRLQTDIRIIDGQSLQVTDAVGESRTFGLEATGAYAPRRIPGLRLETSITAQDHETTEFVVGANDFSGNDVKRIPQFMTNSSVFYEAYGLDAMVNWSHLGDRFADDANFQTLQSVNILTLDLGYTFRLREGKSLRLGLNAYNINDTVGLTEGDPRLPPGFDPAQLPFFNARPVLPERFKVSASYTF
ncbi:MAG: TonB-dependent receptor [Gemmatimonadota bacterium]